MPLLLHHLPKDDSCHLQPKLHHVDWNSIWSMFPTGVKRSYNSFPKRQPAGFLVPEHLCHQHFLSSGRLGDMNIRYLSALLKELSSLLLFLLRAR